MRSLPAITRLSYFDVAIHALTANPSPSVEAVRQAISQHVEELSLRGEARFTKDASEPSAFSNTVVDVLRELMRWGWVEGIPLADSKASFDAIRYSPVPLTEAGVKAAQSTDAERRDMVGAHAIRTNSLFAEFLDWLQVHDLAIPEWTDADFRAVPTGTVPTFAEVRQLAVVACRVYEEAREGCASRYQRQLAPGPGEEFVADAVSAALAKRFARRGPKTHKELVGAAGDGLVKAYLSHFGVATDANGLERAIAWGRDLYTTGSGRAITDVPAWVTWFAGTIERDGDDVTFRRRRVSDHRAEVVHAVHRAYEAAAEPSRLRGMAAPLVPIYVVRESAAYAARVCEPVVDRVIGELLNNPAGERLVQLQLGDLRAFPPSAKPFRVGESRYYYMTIHQRRLE